MRVIIVLACLLAAVYARSMQMPEIHQWLQFKQKHSKTYETPDEEQYRIKVFLANKDFIDAHNHRFARGEVNHTVAINKFADLTNKEFVAMYNNFRPSMKKPSPNVHSAKVGAPIPASVDWRTKGAVTPVKNQAQCGSCWAFSATGSIEGQHQIATGQLVSLSEQQLLDCSLRNNGCHGGNPDLAFQYIIRNHGIDTEASYPYTPIEGPCRERRGKVGATIRSYNDIPSGDEDSLTNAIATVGPISIGIDAGENSFRFYSGGVYYEPDCSPIKLDHAVLAVGYGVDDEGTKYYIVKNSWDRDWGTAGYLNMARGRNNNCGIATMASYPVV